MKPVTTLKNAFGLLLFAGIICFAFYIGQKKGIEQGKEVGKKIGYDKGMIIGEEIGCEQGIIEGELAGYDNAVEEIHKLLFLADRGAYSLFVDENRRTYIPYGYVVNQLQQNDAGIAIPKLVDTLNTAILRSFLNFDVFSKSEREDILAAYQKVHNNFVDEVERGYIEKLSELEQDTTTRKVVGQFMASICDNTCDLVGLLSPLQKQKLTKSLIKSGKASLQKKGKNFNDKLEITAQLLDELTDEICNIIIKSSFVVVDELFKQHIIVNDFTKDVVYSKHKRKLVKKLIAIEDSVTVILKETFKRPIFDANIVISLDAVVNVGVDLDEYFEGEIIQERRGDNIHNYIVITVLSPQILTTGIDFDVKSINEFFSTRLEGKEITYLIRKGKFLAEEKSIDSGILEKAEESLQLVFEQLYAPVLIDKDGYELVVKYNSPMIADKGENSSMDNSY